MVTINDWFIRGTFLEVLPGCYYRIPQSYFCIITSSSKYSNINTKIILLSLSYYDDIITVSRSAHCRLYLDCMEAWELNLVVTERIIQQFYIWPVIMDSSHQSWGNSSAVSVIGKQEHHILTPLTQSSRVSALHLTFSADFLQLCIYIFAVNLRESEELGCQTSLTFFGFIGYLRWWEHNFPEGQLIIHWKRRKLGQC